MAETGRRPGDGYHGAAPALTLARTGVNRATGGGRTAAPFAAAHR